MTKLLSLAVMAIAATSAAATCANDCNGHGTCNIYSSCDCYRNWMGADCSQRTCYFGIAFVDTPQGDLNTDGYVSDNQFDTRFTNQQTWEVYPWYAGWGGKSFQMGTASTGNKLTIAGNAQSEGHFYKECSSKGLCDRITGDCDCFAGFSGEGCTRTACAKGCSGHGVCRRIGDLQPQYTGWDATSTQSCQCDSGYFGADCSLRSCPKGDDPVTKYKSYTRIAFVPGDGDDHYDTSMCPKGTSNKATSVSSGVGPSKNRIWDYRHLTDAIYSNGWEWTPWFARTAYAPNVVAITTNEAGNWHKGQQLTDSSSANDIAYVICGVDVNTGACTTAATTMVIATLGSTGVALSGAFACKAAVGRTPDDYPATFPALSAAADASCTMADGNPNIAVSTLKLADVNTVFCKHNSGSASATGHQLCKDNKIEYHTDSLTHMDAPFPHYVKPAILDYGTMSVTGSTSQATGTATFGCCTAGNNCVTGSPSDCSFWALYLENVSGTYQYGDVIEVRAAAGSATTGSAGTGGLDISLCNYIQSIDTYYAASPSTVQTNEKQILTLSLQPAVSSTALYNLAKLSLATEGSGYSPTEAKMAITFAGSPAPTPHGCAVAPTATVKPSAIGYITSNEVTITNFGSCAFGAGLLITMASPVISPSGAAAVFDQMVHGGAGLLDFIAKGNVVRNHGQLAGSFQGYFALEFTDETGDTWMTESISVTSRKLEAAANGAVTNSAPNTMLLNLDTETKRSLAGVPTSHAGGVEMNPVETTAGYADFIAARFSGYNHVSDARSAANVAARIEAALEALPNGVVPDVEVYYQLTTSRFGAAGNFQKKFAISFLGNSGNVPALKVAYSFRDHDGTASALGATVTNKSYQNGSCGAGATGSQASQTGNTGCGTNAFGFVTAIATGAAAKATITTSVAGTTENEECSNRGLCDYATGKCKCFAGFTEIDCSVQNALSMG